MATLSLRDCYSILGVGPTASLQEVKTSYRALARRYHPDLNPNNQTAAAQFHAIQSAYEMLHDRLSQAQPKLRKEPAPRTVTPNVAYSAFVDGLMGFNPQR